MGDLSRAFLRIQLTCFAKVYFFVIMLCQHGEGGVGLFHHYLAVVCTQNNQVLTDGFLEVTSVLMAIACVLLETTKTTTMPTLTTTTLLIPLADQARVKVNIKLTSSNFTKDLEDKTSEAYKSLKMEVVETVINTDQNISTPNKLVYGNYKCRCMRACVRSMKLSHWT